MHEQLYKTYFVGIFNDKNNSELLRNGLHAFTMVAIGGESLDVHKDTNFCITFYASTSYILKLRYIWVMSIIF